MSLHSTVCPLDCPDACSLQVTVEEGRVTAIDGSEDNPITGGYICAKVRNLPEAVYGPERLLQPAARVGAKGEGRFEPISWDEALDRIVGEWKAIRATYGAEAILPLSYGGSNGLLSQDTTDLQLFNRLGASHLARTVCAIPTGLAAQGLYGKMPGVAHQDYPEAKLIIVWGANPHASGVHLVPYIQQAQENGARLIVVDPRETKLAKRADLHVAPHPGTDLPLALAIINWLFENGHADLEFLGTHAVEVDAFRERASSWNLHKAASICRLSAREIETLASWYAESSPAVLRCGWGLERNRNGGSAVAAVLALPAVAGKFGVRGGGYTMSNSAAWSFSAVSAMNSPMPAVRTVNMNQVGLALTGGLDLAPPIHSLFVYNCNPIATMPNQELVRKGMLRNDLFTVVFDHFATDSALYADIVLPATTFLERRELKKAYGAYNLQDADAVIAPVGESRTNHQVFQDLARRLELLEPGDPQSEEEVAQALLATHPEGERISADLARDGISFPSFGQRPVQFVDVFPRTVDGKVHLVPATLDAEAPLGLYGYQPDPETREHPLALISPASSKMISSTLGQLWKETVPLAMHPADAIPRGIKNGDPVRVFNTYGSFTAPAALDPTVRVGVVSYPKGLWARHSLDGNTSNAVSPDTLTDVGGGACFNDARVQVERTDASE